jgi:hypothetical protein
MLMHQKGTLLDLFAICCFGNDIPCTYLHVKLPSHMFLQKEPQVATYLFPCIVCSFFSETQVDGRKFKT